MIPRYLPDLALSAWCQWLIADITNAKDAKAKFIRKLSGNINPENAFAFVSARQGLYVYFKLLKKTVGKGTVLIPAQICPLVSYIVRKSGFTVRFIDSDISYPTPSADQYLQALDQDTIGIIVSPLYGYIQTEWTPLLERLDQIKLILDLAQGLGLREHINTLFQKADAVVYSFGLGKGLDTGGGLLLTSIPLNMKGYSDNKKKYYVGILLKGAFLKFLNITGLYSYFIKRLESAIEMEKEPVLKELSLQRLSPDGIYLLWYAKYRSFLKGVELARKRARLLSALPLVQKACRDIPIFCSSNVLHLRQVIRFKDVTLRSRVLDTLQQCGVDCAPAGELPPVEYPGYDKQLSFPNAQAFCEESIRLPFLGRMSDKEFDKLKRKLESAIAQHLPH